MGWGGDGERSATAGDGAGGVFGGRGSGEVPQARYSRAAQTAPVPVLRRRWLAARWGRGSGRGWEGETPSASGSVARGVDFPSGEVSPSPSRAYFG